MSGGAAIEKAALNATDDVRYEFPLPLARQKDCMFSFAGLKNTAQRYIKRDELNFQLGPDEVIPHYKDFCAGFLRGITRHICYRTQRAIEFCEQREFFKGTDRKYLVISGGCAANDFLFNVCSFMANQMGFETIRPSKKLCTDNGVMIAWNGVERFINNDLIFHDFDSIDVISKCPFGVKIFNEVEEAAINCKWIKDPKLKILK